MKKKVLATAVLAFVLVTYPMEQVYASPDTAGYEEGWSAVNRRIDAASSGKTANENIKILTGRNIEIPAVTLDKLAGKSAVLAVHAGDGIAVTVTGQALKIGNQSLKITITDIEDRIPNDVGREILADALGSKMFAIEEKTEYPVPLDIHFGMGEEYAGKYANLYHYDEQSDKMVYNDSFVLTNEGRAMFYLGRGDEYILTVTENLPVGGSVRHTIAQGECLIWIARRYGVSLEEVAAANPQIQDARKIRPGQVINIVNM